MTERDPEYAWLFTEEELETLYSSRRPLEGDILLLNSTGLSGTASRTFGGSAYSHVGLVVGSDLYIDAVSKDGVNVRRISDLGQHYDIARCVVVRSHDVVVRAPAVWTSALDYLERPYRLRAVFTKPDGALDDRDPVVCSKLVAMILQDVGLTIRQNIHSMLPRDFEAISPGTEWNRFPLGEYDLFADPSSITEDRQHQTKVWLELVGPLHQINVSLKTALRRAGK